MEMSYRIYRISAAQSSSFRDFLFTFILELLILYLKKSFFGGCTRHNTFFYAKCQLDLYSDFGQSGQVFYVYRQIPDFQNYFQFPTKFVKVKLSNFWAELFNYMFMFTKPNENCKIFPVELIDKLKEMPFICTKTFCKLLSV